MADTTYVDGSTLLTADTMNDLNRLHYTILSDPADVAAVVAALGLTTITFRAYQSTLNSVTSSNNKITLDAESFDVGGYFDSATNSRFTPLVAGYYQLNGAIQFAGGSYAVRAALYKNGSVYSYGGAPAPGSAATVSDVIFLNGSTDYVELYGYSATTQNTTTGATNTYLSGFKV